MSSSNNYAQLRVDPYGLERIEILRGPSSVLYGQNPPGGLVNMMSKRPPVSRFTRSSFWEEATIECKAVSIRVVRSSGQFLVLFGSLGQG